MALIMQTFLALLLPAVCSASLVQPDPAYAKNITVYHVNPHKYGAVPINMDIGDATGDLFFDLFEVILAPLACPNGSASGHGCTNPEAVGTDLMVNKLTLEVDTRFSRYAKCNIGINGSDQRGHKCATGTYCCFCSIGQILPWPCQETLGREDLYETFGKYANSSQAMCHQNAKAADCYRSNVFKKLSADYPGYWYSSLSSGFCKGSSQDRAGCTWRVISVDKIVTRKCHTKVFGDVVRATSPDCFNSCGGQSTNTSSPCWVDCFYKAALGEDSGKPGGAVAGLSIDRLTEAWEKPFLPESEGGCAKQPEWQQEQLMTTVV